MEATDIVCCVLMDWCGFTALHAAAAVASQFWLQVRLTEQPSNLTSTILASCPLQSEQPDLRFAVSVSPAVPATVPLLLLLLLPLPLQLLASKLSLLASVGLLQQQQPEDSQLLLTGASPVPNELLTIVQVRCRA